MEEAAPAEAAPAAAPAPPPAPRAAYSKADRNKSSIQIGTPSTSAGDKQWVTIKTETLSFGESHK